MFNPMKYLLGMLFVLKVPPVGYGRRNQKLPDLLTNHHHPPLVC